MIYNTYMLIYNISLCTSDWATNSPRLFCKTLPVYYVFVHTKLTRSQDVLRLDNIPFQCFKL